MNILITNSKSGAFFEIANGWRNAFIACGHKAELWNGDARTWDIVKPDLFIGCSGWKQDFSKLVKKYNTKLAIHTNPFCNTIIRAVPGPAINEPESTIKWVVAQRPDVIFGYVTQKRLERYWHLWKDNYGLRMVGMPNAADVIKYGPMPPTAHLKCDVGWVGGYWKYKAFNLDKYIVPVVRRFDAQWYGWSGPKGLWRGKADQDTVVRLFNSVKICPAACEPHTTKFGIDVPERIFKTSACGAMTISDPFDGSGEFYEDMPFAKNPKHFMELCERYINMDRGERRKKARVIMKETLNKNTYHHRIQNLLRVFSPEEADKIPPIIKNIKETRLKDFDALN